MSIPTTHAEGFDSTSVPDGSHPFVGYPLIEPADMGPEVSAAIDAALEHFAPVNRHWLTLVKLAETAEVASAIYLALSTVNAELLAADGRAKDLECRLPNRQLRQARAARAGRRCRTHGRTDPRVALGIPVHLHSRRPG